MVTNQMIKNAVNHVVGQRQKLTRRDAFDVCHYLLSLLQIDLLPAKYGGGRRTGTIDRHGRLMCLTAVELDGFKLIPLVPGQELEVMIDGAWRRAKIVESEQPGLTWQRLEGVPDDAPIFGAYARIPLTLEGEQCLTLAEAPKLIKADLKEDFKNGEKKDG